MTDPIRDPQVNIRRALPADAHAIVLCPEDVAESLLHGPNPEQRMEEGIERSRWSVTIEDSQGGVILIGGIVEEDDALIPWMRCSALVEKHKVAVGRQVLRWRDNLKALACGRQVFNLVGKESAQANALLLSLGFDVRPLPTGPFSIFNLPQDASNV